VVAPDREQLVAAGRSRTRRTISLAVTGRAVESKAVTMVSATSASEINSPVSGSVWS
jgi:hypothetical protein